MATLADALTTVTAGIATLLPGIDVATHPGRFTQAELTTLILRQRAVRIAIEQIGELATQGTGQIRAQLVFSAYVVTADSAAAGRHDAALAIVDTLMTAIPFQRWSVNFLAPALPASLRADNLFSGEVNAKGITLWAIGWQQGYQN